MFNAEKRHGPPRNRIGSLIGAGTIDHGNVGFRGGLRIEAVRNPVALTRTRGTGIMGDIDGQELERS